MCRAGKSLFLTPAALRSVVFSTFVSLSRPDGATEVVSIILSLALATEVVSILLHSSSLAFFVTLPHACSYHDLLGAS